MSLSEEPVFMGKTAIDPDQSGGKSDLRLILPSELLAKRSKRWRLSILVGVLDLVSIAAAYITASLLYLNDIDLDQLGRTFLSLVPIVLVLNINNRSYAVDVIQASLRSAWRGSSGLLLASVLMFFVFFFLKISEEFSRAVLGLGAILAMLLIGIARMAASDLARRVFGKSPFIDISIFDGVDPGEDAGPGTLIASDIGLEPRHDDPEMLDRLGSLALSVDSIVVHCAIEHRSDWAFMLKSLDIATEIVTPELTSLYPLAISSRSGEASLVLGSGQLSLSHRTIKRSFDLAVSLAILPLLGPVLLIIALAIRLDSEGPAIFKQDRIGLGNRKFEIFKFRTMRIEMQDDQALKTTSRSDPRVTRVGEFLRRTSLDELPQFINVLLGDMSIVGPRPHAERTAVGEALLWEIDAAYWHRHVVKPGITGLAQVRGHRGSLFEESQLKERLNADLEYVSDWSLANDLKIIMRTVNVLVHKNAF